MSEKIIDEVMRLADDLALKTDAYLNGEASKDEMLAARRTLRSKLREVLERKPLTNEQIDDLHGEANRGFDIESDAYFKAFRDAERAHGINS